MGVATLALSDVRSKLSKRQWPPKIALCGVLRLTTAVEILNGNSFLEVVVDTKCFALSGQPSRAVNLPW